MSYSLSLMSSERCLGLPSLRYRLRFARITSSGMYMPTFPDSIEFSGAGPPAYAILLQLLEVTLKVCHPHYRLNDVRVTRAKTSSPDPRKSDDHYRFPK